MGFSLEWGHGIPNYLVLIEDRDKVAANATETLEEYFITNRFGFAKDVVSELSAPMLVPIHHSLKHGYPASVHALYYYFDPNKKPISQALLEKYDFLQDTIDIPIVNEQVVEILQKHCGNKIQILNTVITFPNGEEVTNYKAINVINRAELFTWEGSVKGIHYDDYGGPNAASMREIAYRNEVIEREVICKDAITNTSRIFINDALSEDLKKARLKGVKLIKEGYRYRVV